MRWVGAFRVVRSGSRSDWTRGCHEDTSRSCRLYLSFVLVVCTHTVTRKLQSFLSLVSTVCPNVAQPPAHKSFRSHTSQSHSESAVVNPRADFHFNGTDTSSFIYVVYILYRFVESTQGALSVARPFGCGCFPLCGESDRWCYVTPTVHLEYADHSSRQPDN